MTGLNVVVLEGWAVGLSVGSTVLSVGGAVGLLVTGLELGAFVGLLV